MSDNNTHTINLLEPKAIPELYGKNFFIPDYQRGYRWGERQVKQLFKDLSDFFDKGKGEFYCLQPIVIKAMSPDEVKHYGLCSDTGDNCWYELIDGQQRLTTIKIILSLYSKFQKRFKDSFTIYYQTRPELGKFFDSFIYDEESAPYHITVPDESNLDIDLWHILQASKTILTWLYDNETGGKGLDYFVGTFKENFIRAKGIDGKKSVQVIWYELKDGSDPNNTFKRLNDKKVSLNNAELIRAMFLSDSAVYEIEEDLINAYPYEFQEIVKERELARKQAHIIEQWDLIEKQLRQSQFWCFVKDDADEEGYSSRIEYLFDLISMKTADERDELYTYLRFEEMVQKREVEGLWALWIKVESYFATLLSWYYDRDFYHKIGFLIAEKGNTILIELLDMSSKQTKTKFRKSVDWLIRKQIMIRIDDDIFKYSYNDSKQYTYLKRILFYFNVESTRRAVSQDNFPFDLYKKETWTLEHIHAQNSERIDKSDKKKWEIWNKENQKVLKQLESRFKELDEFDPRPVVAILTDHENRMQDKKYVFSDFTVCFDSVNAYFNKMAKEEGGTPEIHNISNMALLSGSINSSISNSAFEVKRQQIIKDDADGKYIPYCTKLVFLKYYNKNLEGFSVQHSFFWSENDRKAYLENLQFILEDILNAQDPDK